MDSLTFSEVELFVAFTVIVLSTLALAFCRLCRRRKGEYTFQSWIESASTAQQHKSHVSQELCRAFQTFHCNYTRDPSKFMTRAKRIHRNYMMEIESNFRRNGVCHHLEQTGSSCKAIKAKESSECDDVECDVILVMDKHEYDMHVLCDNARPGYAWLIMNRGKKPYPELNKVLKYWNFLGYMFGGHLYVDPGKTIDILIKELQTVIKKSKMMKGRVKLRRNGPVIQMNVHPDSGFIFWGPSLYSVNLIPAYQIRGVLFVSKPLKEETPNRMTWRQSFSVQEIQNLPEGAESVLHVLKVIHNREPELAPLTPYHLKTALFHEIDSECDWSDHALVQRFVGVLRRLEKCLDKGNLPLIFSPKINLLSGMSSSSLKDMRDIIRSIRSREDELMEILKSCTA